MVTPSSLVIPDDYMVKTACISTAHVSERTASRLSAANPVPHWLCVHEFGWHLNLTGMRLDEHENKTVAWLGFADYFDAETIPNLLALLATDLDCVWFRSVDDLVDGLEVFEW